MKSYKELIVWQKSVTLVLSVYKLTEEFPDAEKFGLISQMRRCAVSIPSNIAEGWGRASDKEKKQFVRIAYGSASELETQLLISYKLGFVEKKKCDEADTELTEVLKMLNGLINKLTTSC